MRRKPVFKMVKIANHGLSNPVVSRLLHQPLLLIDHSNLDKKKADDLKGIFVEDLSPKLLRCWEICSKLQEEQKKEIEKFNLSLKQDSIVHPHVIALEQEAHNFLYEAKNYIRDLTKLINLLYGTSFSEASQFGENLGKKASQKSVADWAEKHFGETDELKNFFRENAGWISYYIKLRNAVEHPGGYSGNLRINNFDLAPDDKPIPPSWQRIPTERTEAVESNPILFDMERGWQDLLGFTEDILGSWLRHNLVNPCIELCQINTDPNCLVRFDIQIKKEIIDQIEKLKFEEGKA